MSINSVNWTGPKIKAFFGINNADYKALVAAVKDIMERNMLLGEGFKNRTAKKDLSECLRNNYNSLPSFVHNTAGGLEEHLVALTGLSHTVSFHHRQAEKRRRKLVNGGTSASGQTAHTAQDSANMQLAQAQAQSQLQAQPARPFELRTVFVRNTIDRRYDGRCTVKDICRWPWLPSTSTATDQSLHPPCSLGVDDFDYDKWTAFLLDECGYDPSKHVLSASVPGQGHHDDKLLIKSAWSWRAALQEIFSTQGDAARFEFELMALDPQGLLAPPQTTMATPVSVQLDAEFLVENVNGDVPFKSEASNGPSS